MDRGAAEGFSLQLAVLGLQVSLQPSAFSYQFIGKILQCIVYLIYRNTVLTRRLNILLHPLLLSLPFAVILILLLPDSFDKYKLSLDEQFKLSGTNYRYYYHDLDHDGYSEAIKRNINKDGSSNFVVFTHTGGIINQWNFKNPWVPHSEFIFGDCNNNGLDEIYGFTWSGDSIFLEGIEVSDHPDTICEKLFIDRIANFGDQNDFSIINGPVINVDDDDQKEIIFAINTGFPMQPRNAYIYDPVKKELLKSPPSGSQIGGFAVVDLDDDGFMEIINTYSIAAHNIHIDIPYNDSSAWLMVFDHRLRFKFEPVEFSGLWTSIDVMPVNKELFVQAANRGKLGGIPRVMRYDVHGTRLSETYLNDEEDKLIANLFTINEKPGRVFLSAGDDRVYEFDYALNIRNQIQIPTKYFRISARDLDLDGKHELITLSKGSNKIIILRHDFSHPVVFEVDGAYLNEITLRLNGDARPQFSLRAGDHQYVLSYFKNPMYVFQYPIWLGIYLLIAGFVFMVQRFQDLQNASKREIELEMTRLQLTNVKNQFDPHFTFNALNTISYVMYKGDKDVAYDYLVRFSKLIRAVLEDSDKILTSLSAEIEFITNYLELQKFRLNDKFEYQIDIPSGLDISKIEVPKMIIQNYVENAVKHGLKNKQGNGMLKILLSEESGKLNVIVEDNGIGREKAKEFSESSTGKGLKLTSQFFQLYKKLYGKQITVHIEDLQAADRSVTGTRVTLRISV